MIYLDRDHNGVLLADRLYEAISGEYDICYLQSNLDVPYPLIAKNLVEHVQNAHGSMGILICKTGIGMSIVANKYPNIYANNCKNEKECYWFRTMNNGNILCLGALNTSEQRAINICRVFLSTEFDPQNQRRIKLIQELFM